MKIPVSFKTSDNRRGCWNLLSADNLRRVGIYNWRDIKRIEPFFHAPGTLYLEPGVRDSRPYGGSIGVWLYTDTMRVSIQDLINYDYNEDKHYNGLEHWNHDRRFIYANGVVDDGVRASDYHIIDASNEIDITFWGETKTIRKQ
jgi:hypothetical protein